MLVVVFFFKQKTAYEMLRSLVGSEMCIRDRVHGRAEVRVVVVAHAGREVPVVGDLPLVLQRCVPVSYTHLTLPTIYSV